MPSYRSLPGMRPKWLSRFLGHKWQTVALTVLLAGLTLLSLDWRNLGIAAGCLLGLGLGPDLDLSWTRLGILGRLSLANEYTALFKHRGISHIPVIGTLTRAPVWLLPVLLVCLIGNWPMPWWAIWRVGWGLVLSDFWHIMWDKLSTHVLPRTSTHRAGRR